MDFALIDFIAPKAQRLLGDKLIIAYLQNLCDFIARDDFQKPDFSA